LVTASRFNLRYSLLIIGAIFKVDDGGFYFLLYWNAGKFPPDIPVTFQQMIVFVQWRAQKLISRGEGGSTNSVEDRGQRERESGGR
jgi:hypothetical protein